MSDKRAPWMKWYPADWRADPKLRMCSLAARGLWAEMLALMHEGEPYGHLLIAGVAPTPKQLAGIVGASDRDVKKLLLELQQADVFSVTNKDVIYSRRMVRDKAKAEQDRINGKCGGNPNLLGADNIDDNRGVNPPIKAHKPEARSHIPDQESLLPDLSDEFAAWYAAYPRKTARGTAEKAYRKARKLANSETLLKAAQRYAEQRKGQDSQYTKHPASWLNGQCWLDEPCDAKAAELPLVENGIDLRQQLRIKGFYEKGIWMPEWGDRPPPKEDVSHGTV